MQGVKLVSTPPAKTKGIALSGLPERSGRRVCRGGTKRLNGVEGSGVDLVNGGQADGWTGGRAYGVIRLVFRVRAFPVHPLTCPLPTEGKV